MVKVAARLFQPSLTDVLGVFLAASVLLVGAMRLFGDSDPAMHVATGSYILTQHSIPQVDPFSATHAGKTWFAHEWLADIVWALVHGVTGWPGLVALSAALIACAHVLLYRFLLRRGDHALPAFLAVIGAAIAAASHWLARPHLLTVLLLVVFVSIIDDFVEGRSGARRLMVLPVMVAFWANVHGGFLVAFPVLGCYLLGALITNRRALRPLLLASAASAVAALVNPYGFRLPVHLLSYFARPREGLVLNAEFAPASFGDRAGIAILVFLALAVMAVTAERVLRRRRPTGADFAFVVTSIMAALSIRHAEIAAVFAALLISRGLGAVLHALTGPATRTELEALRARELRCGGGLFAISLAVLALLAGAGFPASAGYDPSRFPVSMVQQLRREGQTPEGPLFSRDLWGGYLTLEWPQVRVFVDGRSDMYGDAFMQRYGDLYEALPGWQDRLAEAGVRWALLPLDAPIARAMSEDRRWNLDRQDSVAVVFRRAPASNP